MVGTNPVSKWLLSKFTTQDPATYKTAIDNNFNVLQRIGTNFAPYAQDVPNMTMGISAGNIFSGTELLELDVQTTGTIVAPVSNSRIDRVVISSSTGLVSVITGTTSITPSAPNIPAGYLPVARILLTSTTLAITNSIITDERNFNYSLVNLSNNITNTLPVSHGGTGVTSITSNALLVGNGEQALTTLLPSTTGILKSNGSSFIIGSHLNVVEASIAGVTSYTINLPSNPTIQKITINLYNVARNSANSFRMFQISTTSNGVYTSGYGSIFQHFWTNQFTQYNNTSGFIFGNKEYVSVTGNFTIIYSSISNSCTCTGSIYDTNLSSANGFSTGSIPISGVINGVKITTTGNNDTFSSGSYIKVVYET